LIFAPEAVVHPSFQMSFAATLALIALYQGGLPVILPSTSTAFGMRVALWGGREIIGLTLASLVAGFATTPYAAYHFHRLAPYGVLANLLAMPIVSAWVMPMGMVALVLMPFGYDGIAWRAMGSGIDWMDTVALWVASLPGAVGRMAAFGAGPLILATAGLLVVCMLRTPLRWIGALLLAAAALWAARTPQPDILVAHDGHSFAVRTDGRLAILRTGSDSFAARDWLAGDADARTGKEPELRQPFVCDEAGCTARLAGGGIVAVALSPEAFAEDCRRATVVLSPRTAPPGCHAVVVDRTMWRSHGAVTLAPVRRTPHRARRRRVCRPSTFSRRRMPTRRNDGPSAS
jgi:competence protein ComEC